MTERDFMLLAIDEAKKAADTGDVPVGAVIVLGGEVIARAHNEREAAGDATAHAELLAIRRAGEVLGRWRLSDCELYVTLEPCPMCAGAILNSRLKKVYYATKDARAGAFGSILNLNSYPLLYKIPTEAGLCENESACLLREFFEHLRDK